MSRRPIRTAVIAAGAILASIAGYTAYWYTAAGEVRKGIDRWTEERRGKGWTVELGTPEITGFPFRIDLFLQTPALAGPGGAWRWSMPNVAGTARPWALGQIEISAAGTHVISARDDAAEVRLARAEGELSVGIGRFDRVLVRLAGVDWRQKDGARTRIDTLSVHVRNGVAVGDETDDKATGTGIALDARRIELPEAWKPPLGTGLGRLSIDAVVLGNIEPRGKLPEALARWRDAGGAVEVKAFVLDWQALSIAGDGTFALDDSLQPQGAMSARIGGIDRTADALIAAGVIDTRTAFAAKVANRALSFGGGAARLPLSIQQQKLYLGPVPLFRLKPVRWE